MDKVQPKLVVCSPECRMSSAVWNPRKWGKAPELKLEEVEEHLPFLVELYKKQIDGMRCLVHEHQAGAMLWQMTEIIMLEMETGVTTSIVD